jgi:hypothetical protein
VTDEYDDADFDEEFFEYARRALEMAGIETDAKLKATRPIRHSLLHCISENIFYYRAAQEKVPQSDAHWEQSLFLQVAMRAAIWDLQWGAIRNFSQFDFLYRRILGDRSRRYLPQLFAAAAWSPGLDATLASRLLASLPNRVWYEPLE